MNILFLTRYTEYSVVFQTAFDEENYSCSFVHSFDSLLSFISRQLVDIIFIDFYLPRKLQIEEFLHQFLEAEEIIIPVLTYNAPLQEKSLKRSEVLFQLISNKYAEIGNLSLLPVFSLIEKSLAKISFYRYLNTMYLKLENSDRESDRILNLLNKNRNTVLEMSQLIKHLSIKESHYQNGQSMDLNDANKKAAALRKRVYSCIHELRLKYEVNANSPKLIVSPKKDCYMLIFPV